MKRNTGFSLIEMMVALVAGALSLFAVSFLVVQAQKDLGKNKQLVALQGDLDLASYTIKGVIEEADGVSMPDGNPGNHIVVYYGSVWRREFYPDPANANILILKDTLRSTTERVIDSLSSISFTFSVNTVTVTVSVQGAGRTIQNSFAVYLRNI